MLQAMLSALINHILITGMGILLLVLRWQKSRLDHQVPVLVRRGHALVVLLLLVLVVMLVLLLLLHLLGLGDTLLQLGCVHVRLSWRADWRGRVPIRVLREQRHRVSSVTQTRIVIRVRLAP